MKVIFDDYLDISNFQIIIFLQGVNNKYILYGVFIYTWKFNFDYYATYLKIG